MSRPFIFLLAFGLSTVHAVTVLSFAPTSALTENEQTLLTFITTGLVMGSEPFIKFVTSDIACGAQPGIGDAIAGTAGQLMWVGLTEGTLYVTPTGGVGGTTANKVCYSTTEDGTYRDLATPQTIDINYNSDCAVDFDSTSTGGACPVTTTMVMFTGMAEVQCPSAPQLLDLTCPAGPLDVTCGDELDFDLAYCDSCGDAVSACCCIGDGCISTLSGITCAVTSEEEHIQVVLTPGDQCGLIDITLEVEDGDVVECALFAADDSIIVETECVVAVMVIEPTLDIVVPADITVCTDPDFCSAAPPFTVTVCGSCSPNAVVTCNCNGGAPPAPDCGVETCVFDFTSCNFSGPGVDGADEDTVVKCEIVDTDPLIYDTFTVTVKDCQAPIIEVDYLPKCVDDECVPLITAFTIATLTKKAQQNLARGNGGCTPIFAGAKCDDCGFCENSSCHGNRIGNQELNCPRSNRCPESGQHPWDPIPADEPECFCDLSVFYGFGEDCVPSATAHCLGQFRPYGAATECGGFLDMLCVIDGRSRGNVDPEPADPLINHNYKICGPLPDLCVPDCVDVPLDFTGTVEDNCPLPCPGGNVGDGSDPPVYTRAFGCVSDDKCSPETVVLGSPTPPEDPTRATCTAEDASGNLGKDCFDVDIFFGNAGCLCDVNDDGCFPDCAPACENGNPLCCGAV